MRQVKNGCFIVILALCLSLAQYFVSDIPGRLVFGPILFVLVSLYIINGKGLSK